MENHKKKTLGCPVSAKIRQSWPGTHTGYHCMIGSAESIKAFNSVVLDHTVSLLINRAPGVYQRVVSSDDFLFKNGSKG